MLNRETGTIYTSPHDVDKHCYSVSVRLKQTVQTSGNMTFTKRKTVKLAVKLLQQLATKHL